VLVLEACFWASELFLDYKALLNGKRGAAMHRLSAVVFS